MQYRRVRGHGKALMSANFLRQLQQENDAAVVIARSLTPQRVRSFIKQAKSRKEVEQIATKALLALSKSKKSRKSPKRKSRKSRKVSKSSRRK